MDLSKRAGMKKAILGAGVGAFAIAGIKNAAAETIITDVGISTDGKRFTDSNTIVIGGSGNVDMLCDGISDDVQFQAAIDAITALGEGKILLRAGEYNFSSALSGFSGIPIIGEDKYSTVINLDDCNFVTPATDDIFILENVTINGTNTTSGQGMVFNAENVYFSAFVKNSIFSTLVTTFRAYNDYEGVDRTELGSFIFESNDFIDCGRTNDAIFAVVNGIGILAIHGPKAPEEELRITNNNFYKVTATQKDELSAINLTGDSTSGDGTDTATCIQGGIVSGNYIQETPYDPIYISDSRLMMISNNRIGTSGRFGCSFNRGFRNVIHGNIIVNCQERAFRLEHNTYCVWTDNHCINANLDDTSTDAAVVFPSCHDNIFAFNSFNTREGLPAYRIYDTISGTGTTYPAYDNFIFGNRHTGSDIIDYRDGCELLNTFFDIRNLDNTVLKPNNCRLIGYLPLNRDDDIKDMVTRTDGTVNGSPTWTTAYFGKALSLDSLDESVETGVVLDMTVPFAVAFAYNPAAKAEATVKNICCTYRDTTDGPIRISKQIDGEIQVNIYVSSVEYAINLVIGDYDLETMFFIAGWDGSKLFLYINGELYDTNEMAATPTGSSLNFILGARYDDSVGSSIVSETPNMEISHFMGYEGVIDQTNARAIWANYKNKLYNSN